MTNNKPKVSVILTAHNHAKYLRESIDSVLNQTFTDFELLILDDGSTDDSWQMIGSYSDSRLRAYSSTSLKREGDLVNKAIHDLVSGKYIAIHHSDVIWEHIKLEKQVSFLDQNPQFGAVFSNASIIGEDGDPLEDTSHYYYKVFEQPNRNRYEWLNYFFYHGNALCHPSVLIRKVCYDDCGLYRYGFTHYGDYDMWVRLCLKYEIHVLSEKLAKVRVYEDSKNPSASGPQQRGQFQFELLQIYSNFKAIRSSKEFLKVFPKSQKYFLPDGFDVDYALGMVALDSETSNPAKLFGLNLLFKLLNNPERAEKVKTLYRFTPNDFMELTGQHDVFSLGRISRLTQTNQALQVEKNYALRTLNELRNSTAFRLISRYRLLIDRFFSAGTSYRRLYNFGIKVLQVLFREGIKGILRRIRSRSVNVRPRKLHFKRRGRLSFTSSDTTSTSPLNFDQGWDERTPLLSLLSIYDLALEVLPEEVLNHAKRCVKEKPLRISVVMATWNRENTICIAVESALNQSYPPYEIIVSDDGSTDDTVKLIRENFPNDVASGKIQILENPHMGVSATRNHALETVKGDVIAYLDSDNAWREHYLLLVAATFAENDEIYTTYAALKSNVPHLRTGNILFKPYDRRELLISNYIDLNIFAHRREIIEQQGLFDETLTRLVDWELIIRYTRNYSPAMIPYIGVDYYLDSTILNNITLSIPLEENLYNVHRKHMIERLRLGIIPLRMAYILWDFPTLSQTFVMNELRWLVDNGYDVKVYYSAAPDKAFQVDFPIEAYQVKDAGHLASLLVDHDRNYCHSHFVYPAVTLLAYPACLKVGIPFTFMPHAVDLFHYENRQRNRIQEIAQHPLCQKVIVYGDHHKLFLEEQGISLEKIAFAFQAVEIKHAKQTVSKEHRSLSHQKALGVVIARFIEKKGIRYLIDAAKLLQNEPVEFEIYGYGPLEDSYKRQIASLGLKNVSLKGPLRTTEELLATYKRADFILVPSVIAENGDMDGFPTVIFEAMANEIPVIVTSVSAVPDYVSNRMEAFLVPPADAQALADAVLELIHMPESKRRAMLSRANTLLEQRLGVDKTMTFLLDIWLDRQVDIFLVTYNTREFESRKDTFEIVRRILEKTTTPYTLTIIDNASDDDFWQELKVLVRNRPNIRFIRKEKNILLGPASNVAVRVETAKYSIYVCSKEGFIKAHGWERDLINYMRNDAKTALAGHHSYQPNYVYGREILEHPEFKNFRNQEFAQEHPSKPFTHIQGGIFIMDREVYTKEGGFNPAIPQGNVDIELSYYLESKGYKLGKIPTLTSITTKTRPTITALLDENTVAAHPLSLVTVSSMLDSLGKDEHCYCNVCGWQGASFDVEDNAEYSLSKCPDCSSTSFGRMVFRFLASDYRANRKERAAMLSVDSTLEKMMTSMFNFKVKEVNAQNFMAKLKSTSDKMSCIVLETQCIPEDVERALWAAAINALDDDGEIIFADKYWIDNSMVENASNSGVPIFAEVARKNQGVFRLEYIDYKSVSLGIGWQRLGRISKIF